ncbi:nectin-2 isoform X1 [Pseudoliparis swirei]|uniref:nectin-2 isoform X1 n=1 Tax=Pseudoliparis swirei TaxID=2059687 RepID=UPI0024BE1711|nr:nectin-2 isoform X1 [Pseudoliparis swirei]
MTSPSRTVARSEALVVGSRGSAAALHYVQSTSCEGNIHLCVGRHTHTDSFISAHSVLKAQRGALRVSVGLLLCPEDKQVFVCLFFPLTKTNPHLKVSIFYIFFNNSSRETACLVSLRRPQSTMARRDARNWHDCSKMIGPLCLLASILLQHGVSSQRVKVEPEVLSYPGQTVNLRCAFTDATGIQLTMVTWIYEPKDGERINIAVFHPKFEPNYPLSPVKGRVGFSPSPPNVANPSIEITNVRMNDEGKYICEYATYPIGNEQGITYLVMLAKPQNSASIVTVEAGSKPVVVARCESVDGRPAAKISWVTAASGNGTTVSKTGADNTETISSEYSMIPTAADNGEDLSCVVAHRTQVKPESFPLKLAVQYAPLVTIVGYDNNWYVGRTNVMLTCQATGNPTPTTTQWKMMSGEKPDTVQITDNVLKVLKVDDAVNTTFVCEVKNRIGIGREKVTVIVREPSVNPSNAGVVAGAVIGSLLALLLVAALIAVLVTRSHRQQQGYRSNGGSDMKTRVFGGGKKASKTARVAVRAGNNNGPVYVYDENSSHQGLGEKNNHHQPLTIGGRPEVVATTPTAQDILLSNELDDGERRKFDELEEDERYDQFTGGAPILQLRPPHDQDDMIGDYMDDDMESQRDGSVISRTAVYV